MSLIPMCAKVFFIFILFFCNGPSQERPELGLGCGGTRMKGINGPAVAQE